MINQIISHQKSNLFLNFANIKGCRSGTCGVLQCNLRRIHTLLMASCSERNLIGRRTESDRTADGNRLGGGRNPIGRRTETDWVADGNRLGGGRNLIGWRTESDGRGGTFRGCTCLKCTNKAAPTKQCTNSPQNTQNTQNILAEKASHR